METPQGGQLVFITGPPGAGKTTTAMLWSIRRERPTFVLDWDLVAAVMAHAGVDADDIERRYRHAADVLAEMARAIVDEGNDCAVVGARLRNPPDELAVWAAIDALEPLTIVLLPSASACVERNASDRGRRGAFSVPENTVRSSHAAPWEDWAGDARGVVLDTTAMTLEAAVDEVERAVAQLIRVQRSHSGC